MYMRRAVTVTMMHAFMTNVGGLDKRLFFITCHPT